MCVMPLARTVSNTEFYTRPHIGLHLPSAAKCGLHPAAYRDASNTCPCLGHVALEKMEGRGLLFPRVT